MISNSASAKGGATLFFTIFTFTWLPIAFPAEFEIIYNHGINKEGSLLAVGLSNGVVEKKGAWLKFDGELIGQGKEAARAALAEKPEIAKKIMDAVMAKRAAGETSNGEKK